MNKSILIICVLLLSFHGFSQDLIHKSNGNISDSQGKKLTSDEVRELLANNVALLEEYNIGRDKKTFGNILLFGGAALAYFPTMIQLANGQPVSTGLFGAGVISMLIAIPVKVGFTKKIKNVVSEYNKQKKVSDANLNIKSTNIIANSNGVGVRFTLN